jgi:hypothetical protein
MRRNMKNKVILIFLVLPFFCLSQIIYKYDEKGSVNYSFQIQGDISFSYPGTKEEKFKFYSKGNLKIETVKTEGDFYYLKVTPFKTTVKVGENVFEDLTNSETGTSSFISSCMVKMRKNGEIIEMNDLTGGLLTLKQILKILPTFPENMTHGKRWEQKIPAFSFPGIPMCDIKFIYLYEKKNLIKLTGSQIIKETKKEKDTKIIFSGKNISNGIFNFNEEEGIISNFNGDFSIELFIKFEVPPSPDIKSSKTETVPMKVNLNFNLQISKI